MNCDTELPEIRDTGCFSSGILGIGERRQQQGGEDRDNGDYDQELDQGKTVTGHMMCPTAPDEPDKIGAQRWNLYRRTMRARSYS